MSLLRSKSLRVFHKSGSTWTDVTEAMRIFGGVNLSVAWNSAVDSLYLGLPHKFSNRYIKTLGAPTPASAVTASYWNGSAWANFESFLDETDGFIKSGFIQWEERPEWRSAKPADVTDLAGNIPFTDLMYWIKLTRAVTLGVGDPIVIDAIKFLMSDDRSIATIYPEINQYLPTGQTDWLKQHELAKDSIIGSLIREGLIQYEEQIKNVEDWLLCASYKAIELVLDPITGDERLDKVKEKMAMNSKIQRRDAAATLDKNKNEVADPSEKEPGWDGSIEVKRR